MNDLNMQLSCFRTKMSDFRPDYLKLGKLRSLTGSGVPWLALTATASSTVVEDIHKQLSLKKVKQFKVIKKVEF